jgi:hypothetical protein
LIATVISEAIRVSFRAATAWGLLIAAQKLPTPLVSDSETTAARGSRTSRLR